MEKRERGGTLEDFKVLDVEVFCVDVEFHF